MFKKFKDKLAEEVKSSPQRLQQFAQAAQAAVTSASSSISDITNNDLFSIGDSDSASKSQTSSTSQQSTFRDMSPVYQGPSQPASDLTETGMLQEESQRQRRLSNSSFASDISFRLPSYESPLMYHLQSDMEVSASEAEEKGISGGTANLDRVTKEQLYSAYRRTHDRCKKYKTQYVDLARHYKLLERENAKAKNVLVETQDKALRRISELREQCSLEQSAKAHLERALRIEIDEKNMKIHSLNTKLDLLQNNPEKNNDNTNHKKSQIQYESDMQLINLNDNDQKESHESLTTEISVLNNKLEKMEQLLNKYKESLKVAKEKNAQMTTEIQILSTDLQAKSKENEELQVVSAFLADSKKKNQELNEIIEELQNKCNTYEFTENKEKSILEMNLHSAHEDIVVLKNKIEELKKREEEYAISLAENKLSIHKELEGKEAEIKSLKDSLTEAQNEIQSLNIIINNNKNNISALETERLVLKSEINELSTAKTRISDMETQLDDLKQKCLTLESSKTKLDEQYKCLLLQMKQETAEKLAMVDRNTYLENRNAQLTEENAKKSSQIRDLELEIESHCGDKHDVMKEADLNLLNEVSIWKAKYQKLEMEIQDEREELIKLQSEIEKLIRNHELIQSKNKDLIDMNSELKKENNILQEKVENNANLKEMITAVNGKIKGLGCFVNLISEDTRSCFKFVYDEMFITVMDKISTFNTLYEKEMNINKERYNELKINYDLSEKELLNISNKYKVATKELQILRDENNNFKSKIEKYKSDILQMEDKLKSASKLHEVSMEEITLLKGEIDVLKREIDSNSKLHLNDDEKLKILKEENQKLLDELKETEKRICLLNTDMSNEKIICEEKIRNAELQNQISLDEIISLKKELGNLKNKMQSDAIQHLKEAESIKVLEEEKCSLRDQLSEKENNIRILNININKEKNACKEKIEEIATLSNNYNTLLKENEQKEILMKKLQENVESLTQENLTLKKLSETISVNVNKLELEINDVRNSHAEIEKEKNHLNSIIEQLEKSQIKENKEESSNKDSIQSEIEINRQTDMTDLPEMIKKSEIDSFISELTEEKIDILNRAPCTKCNDHFSNLSSLQNEQDVLKEENKRLKSDVEGLQVYLAKISKENSELNDKLREYIASGDHIPEKNEILYNNVEELRFEIQAGKEKIDNLIRENTILVEENLELKDQIQTQSYDNYPRSQSIRNNNNADQDFQNIKHRYKTLLDEKNKLEKRLSDMEQMNQSVDNNMHQLQINNEKLRLSNEKLERRLDEALVSLRHLHSLQENTELEYLRNILYEYLTGSGTHSLTLAKVLAAVVKFSDSQTDLVLQKERERQGFLRQMGLL